MQTEFLATKQLTKFLNSLEVLDYFQIMDDDSSFIDEIAIVTLKSKKSGYAIYIFDSDIIIEYNKHDASKLKVRKIEVKKIIIEEK